MALDSTNMNSYPGSPYEGSGGAVARAARSLDEKKASRAESADPDLETSDLTEEITLNQEGIDQLITYAEDSAVNNIYDVDPRTLEVTYNCQPEEFVDTDQFELLIGFSGQAETLKQKLEAGEELTDNDAEQAEDTLTKFDGPPIRLGELMPDNDSAKSVEEFDPSAAVEALEYAHTLSTEQWAELNLLQGKYESSDDPFEQAELAEQIADKITKIKGDHDPTDGETAPHVAVPVFKTRRTFNLPNEPEVVVPISTENLTPATEEAEPKTPIHNQLPARGRGTDALLDQELANALVQSVSPSLFTPRSVAQPESTVDAVPRMSVEELRAELAKYDQDSLEPGQSIENPSDAVPEGSVETVGLAAIEKSIDALEQLDKWFFRTSFTESPYEKLSDESFDGLVAASDPNQDRSKFLNQFNQENIDQMAFDAWMARVPAMREIVSTADKTFGEVIREYVAYNIQQGNTQLDIL